MGDEAVGAGYGVVDVDRLDLEVADPDPVACAEGAVLVFPVVGEAARLLRRLKEELRPRPAPDGYGGVEETDVFDMVEVGVA